VTETEPALPRALVKYPFLRAISAGAWVMFSSKPSRTVTGADAESPELVPSPLLEPDEQPAMRSAPPTTAATLAKTLRMKFPFSID
jgi:hypothetical protein